MAAVPHQPLAPGATGRRTSIPLRSILNAEEGCDSAEKSPPKVSSSAAQSVKVERAVAQRSQFLFVNTSNASKPNARLRQDQRVINAHVQHTSHRQRRAAGINMLKRTFRLCPHCAQFKAGGRLKDPKCESIPSGSASEPSATGAKASHGPLRPPLQKDSHTARVCGRCGDSLQPTKGPSDDLDARKMSNATASPVLSALASSKGQASQLTLFVVDQPTSFLDTGMLDPFATSSVSLNMEMNEVLLHFIRVIIGGMYPVHSQAVAQTEFSFQLCLAEPAAMFALLAVSSVDLHARTGRLLNGPIETTSSSSGGGLFHRKMPAFVNYKAKALKAISEKTTSNKEIAEIVAIGVVMSCLLLESITGNLSEMSRHVTELQRLLVSRGGYRGLPTPIVSVAVPTSYMFATMTRSFPMSHPLSPLPTASMSTYERITSQADPQLKQIGTKLLDPDVAALFDESLLKAFCNLREVILYREFFHNQECNLPEIEVEYFNIKAYETLHRTLAIPFQFPITKSPQQEPCRLALLVFWYANYAIHLPDSGIFRSLTTQLKSALEQSNPQSLWQPHSSLFVWVTFLGAYISVGQREYSWFVMYLARAARLRGLESSDNLRAVLQPFFYIDRIYRKGLQDIWDEANVLIEAI